MKKERTTLELLELMLENIDDYIGVKFPKDFGLCNMAESLCFDKLITEREKLEILYRIDTAWPASVELGHYWFLRGEIGPRKKWLEQQIKYLKSKKI